MDDSRRAALLKPTAEGRDLGFSRGVVALATDGSVSLSFSGFPSFLNGTNYLFVEGVGSEFFKLDYPSFRGVLAKGDEGRRSVAVVYIVQKEAIIVLYGRFFEIGMSIAEVKKYAERFFFGENGVAKTKGERFYREGKRNGEARFFGGRGGGEDRAIGGNSIGVFDTGKERCRGGENIETRSTNQTEAVEKQKIDFFEKTSAERNGSGEYDDEVVATDNYFYYDAASRGKEYRGESQKDQDARIVGCEKSLSQKTSGGDFACENEICQGDSVKGFLENGRFGEGCGERIVKDFSNYGEARIVGERVNAADQEGADADEGRRVEKLIADEERSADAEEIIADEGRSADAEKGDPEFERRFFFESVRKEMDELFESFPKEESLSKMVAESKWVKVSYEGEKSYVVGIIYSEQTPIFICYGVPGKFGEKPSEFKGYCSFIPSSPFALEKDGYWVIYQDARTGERV